MKLMCSGPEKPVGSVGTLTNSQKRQKNKKREHLNFISLKSRKLSFCQVVGYRASLTNAEVKTLSLSETG